MEIGRLMGLISKNFEINIKQRLMSSTLDHDFEQNHSYIQYLAIVNAKDGVHQNDIAKYMHVKKASASKAVKYLLDRKLVYRQVDENDQRIKRVYITDKGREEVQVLKSILKDLDHSLIEGLSKSEVQTLSLLLEKVFDNIVVDQTDCFIRLS